MQPDTTRPFGRVLTAMVTPFTPDGALDVDAAQRLASYLVSAEGGNDGLVISGTTGESPTTTDEEKDRLLRAVLEAVGEQVPVIAGVGTYDTAHTVHLAQAAEKAGARGVLVVTPYYSKPPQAGLLAHFRMIADATGLPAMLYDIPGRTGTPISTDTLLRLAEHPRIVAVKDAKGDLEASADVMARCDLVFYSGDDRLTLPLLSIGAVGVVGVPTHLLGRRTAEMIAAYEAGDVTGARDLHRALLPAYIGTFRTQGVITMKAALNLVGRSAGPVRPPLVDATPDEIRQLQADFEEAGAPLTPESRA
jgi:4-hydroxy-tetrahydrodipicolinate synthase